MSKEDLLREIDNAIGKRAELVEELINQYKLESPYTKRKVRLDNEIKENKNIIIGMSIVRNIVEGDGEIRRFYG